VYYARQYGCEAQAKVTAVDPQAQTVTVVDDRSKSSQLPYDVLVLAIGARSITWGVPGVEEVRQCVSAGRVCACTYGAGSLASYPSGR